VNELTEQPKFTLAWVTCANEKPTLIGDGSRVLFVRHPERGWEIPGGHIIEGETPEQALLRELEEETGCVGKLVAWNKEYYPKGWVGHVIVEDESGITNWEVEDKNVSEVRWWKEVPPLIEWTMEEFQDLSEWCFNL
jgi:8-oxo-dGTP diphosphatase